jgi:hypothetical protein
MKSLVFFLEEYSARAMLEGLLPRLLPELCEVYFRSQKHYTGGVMKRTENEKKRRHQERRDQRPCF